MTWLSGLSRYALLGVALALFSAPVLSQDPYRSQPCVSYPGGPPCPPTSGTVDPRTGSDTLRTPVFGNQRPPSGRQPYAPQRPDVFPQPGTTHFDARYLPPPFEQEPPRRNEFQDFVFQSTGQMLPIFGHNLFSGVPSTFAPVDNVPVTPDYLIGPGDEILIRAWGQVDIDHRAVVDRNGVINIPQVGNVAVAGIRYQSLEGYIRNAVGRIFRNFDMSVTLGQLRSIQIFVVGHARRPGGYTVSSLSTLVNAVFAAGGPATTGSMRNIQLKRGDKLITEFDLYDLLLKGDKSKDVPLLSGDVIYFAPVGDLVAVAGSVNEAAIYELKGKTTLEDLLRLSGGLSATAEGRKVTLERIDERKMRQVQELALDRAGLSQELKRGDLVRVYALSPRIGNAVTLRGSVANPGRYPWREGMTVRDILPDKDALISPDYWRRQNLASRPELYDPREPLALQRDPYGTQRDPAAPRDPSMQRDPYGAQRNGVTGPRDPSASFDSRSRQGRLPLVGALEQQRREELASPDGRRRIGPLTAIDPYRSRIEVKRSYEEINWDYAVVERLNYEDLTTMLIPFNLGKAVLEGDPTNNIQLRPGDVVTVFSKEDIQVPVAKQTKFVRLEGELVTPGVYQIMPGETLRQLVARVGGVSPNAYLFGAEFTREATRIFQQQRLDEAIDFLDREIQRNMATMAGGSLSREEADAAKVQAEGQRQLVDRLRQIRATGRIVLELSPERMEMRDLPDLVLDDGDRFVVPARPSTVSVVGAVYNQNAFLYRSGTRLSDYLTRAGGPTKDADTGSLYVVRADGSVISQRQSGWIFDRLQGAELMPGDTIVVPEKLDKFRLTKELKDWSQIFYQFALGVAGIKVLRDL